MTIPVRLDRSIHVGMLLLALLAVPAGVTAEPQQIRFEGKGAFLTLEFPRDDLVHFELSTTPLAAGASVSTTPQVAKTDYVGATSLVRSGADGRVLDTPLVKVVVDPQTLCMTLTDKVKNGELSRICTLNAGQPLKGLTMTPGPMQNVYGLGEQFITPAGTADGDWTASRRQVRTPGDDSGNQLKEFNGGMTGNVLIPVMYAVGPSSNYALFLDHIYKQRWDFSGNPWKVETLGDSIRGYVITGADLPQLRQRYMELTGRPTVPPKKMFGLWVSEFGYDNWQEIEGKLGTLRGGGFPVDGFVLDLQWFGGVPFSGTQPSRMGSLSWDTKRFPAPREHIAGYRDREGVGIIAIEESYVDKSLPEHADLAQRGYLVRRGCATCEPVYIRPWNDWWGSGGMIDWTLAAAADHWHDTKRAPLIEDGIIGHWIDLGEPENYDPKDWAAGVLPDKHQHADYHNAYNLEWARSIARGYERRGEQRRPFILSRSGTAGIQRFGAGLWSGDIGADLDNLASHLNVQMHMSMSGIDYFGSDIGGYQRRNIGGKDLELLYTQWFAVGMALDVPARPHTENVCNCKETAPDRVGDRASNLANLRQRYALGPYLYSLAHRAYLAGEPVVPPLVYYYQSDANVRQIGHEKLLGRDLLVATVASRRAPTQRDVYLPAGDWVDWYGNTWLHSTGQTFAAQPLYRNGLFRLPMYARGGAIVPLMYVDDKTMNIVGKRSDGTVHDELIVRVYASPTPSQFTLYEDDGETIAYRAGAVRTTLLAQQLASNGATASVTVGGSGGSYAGAPDRRDVVVELVTDGLLGQGVMLNASPLELHQSRTAFDSAASGWLNAGRNLVVAKSGPLAVTAEKTFVFTLSRSAP